MNVILLFHDLLWLKLEKALQLYYIHLGLFDEPLFPERIEAWQHGPVVPDVYRYYRDYGSEPILPEEFNTDYFDERVQEFLDEIYSTFGQYSAWKLREMAHDEPPWKDCYENDVENIEISHASLKEYFSNFVEESE